MFFLGQKIISLIGRLICDKTKSLRLLSIASKSAARGRYYEIVLNSTPALSEPALRVLFHVPARVMKEYDQNDEARRH